MLLLKDGAPIEPSAQEGVTMRLLFQGAGQRAAEAEDEAAQSTPFKTLQGLADSALHSLDFVEQGRDHPAPWRVDLAIPEAYLPKLIPGRTYEVTFLQNHRGMFLPPAQGLIIRGDKGDLLYLLSTDEAVPLSQLPGGVTLLPSRKVAYTTASNTSLGCVVEKDHVIVHVTVGDSKTPLVPLARTKLATPDGAFALVLFDCSVSETDIECLAEAPTHFSYLLIAESVIR
jgi:hypothetical protein